VKGSAAFFSATLCILCTLHTPSSHSNCKKALAGELTKDWREKHPELTLWLITDENSAESHNKIYLSVLCVSAVN
jgi:hypothetical protein